MAGVLLFVILQTAYPWQNSLSPERAFSGAKMSSAIVLSQDGPHLAAGETSKIRLSDQTGTVQTRQKGALRLLRFRVNRGSEYPHDWQRTHGFR
jgi:6-phosphogluconolactonase (cycloisomerase 2 family)